MSARSNHNQTLQLQHDNLVSEHSAQMEAVCAEHTAELSRIQQQCTRAGEEAGARSDAHLAALAAVQQVLAELQQTSAEHNTVMLRLCWPLTLL